jgi:hypothetical protein
MKCQWHSEHLDIALGGRFEGVETLLGRSERGCFVKAPSPYWLSIVTRIRSPVRSKTYIKIYILLYINHILIYFFRLMYLLFHLSLEHNST